MSKKHGPLWVVSWWIILFALLVFLALRGEVLALVVWGLLAVLAGHWLVMGFRNENVVEEVVKKERQRIARDLHDTLAQELSFVVRSSRRLERRLVGNPEARRIADAAERALHESRSVIARLSSPKGLRLNELLAREVRDIAGRENVEVLLYLQSVNAPEPVDEALIRIAREAVVNAVRHGRAQSISVELTNGRGIHLSIQDDGVGFDPSRPHPGFGLTSMKERAANLGGDLNIRSSPGGGTEVDVVVPS
jgi:signal transduction histidine kinase